MSTEPDESTNKKVIRGLILWIIVPVTLFVVGYRFVGPKIGEVPELKKQVEGVESLLVRNNSKSDPPTEDDKVKSDEAKGPNVEVTVEKSGKSRVSSSGRSSKSTKRKRKRTSTGRTTAPIAPHKEDGPSEPSGGTGTG
ncbi:MAG: hypothetical protein JNM34_06745 [Chthonomonadaceae bacterium]|nr:hypothetical protein [Chthonomonadaceae bacterium]